MPLWDAEYQGIMPVRGKILNCLKADYARIFKTSLDFSEGDFDGAYKIWGIQLDKDTFYKQKLPKEAA